MPTGCPDARAQSCAAQRPRSGRTAGCPPVSDASTASRRKSRADGLSPGASRRGEEGRWPGPCQAGGAECPLCNNGPSTPRRQDRRRSPRSFQKGAASASRRACAPSPSCNACAASAPRCSSAGRSRPTTRPRHRSKTKRRASAQGEAESTHGKSAQGSSVRLTQIAARQQPTKKPPVGSKTAQGQLMAVACSTDGVGPKGAAASDDARRSDTFRPETRA